MTRLPMFLPNQNSQHGRIENSAASIWRDARLHADFAPSLRIPVTPGNRGLLRHLRAIEMAAWQEPAPGLPSRPVSTEQPSV
jgi:hypothetical protein